MASPALDDDLDLAQSVEDLAVEQLFAKAGVAHLAMCCKQSVVTALADLERLGFITRIRAHPAHHKPLGFTTRQITKAYRVHEPTRELGLIAMTLFATDFRHLKRRLLVVSAGKSAARRMLSGREMERRWNGDGTMRYETGTFELRDNDMVMRELSSAETDEVAGGLGNAQVAIGQSSGAGSSLSSTGSFSLATTPTSAFAMISANVAATGPNKLVQLAAIAQVM